MDSISKAHHASSPRASRARGAGTTFYLIVVAILAALVLAFVLLERRSPPSERPPAGPTAGGLQPGAGGRLDPRPFRSQVEALEAVLYRPGPADAATGAHVSYAARQLADVVRTATEGTSSQLHWREIASFAQEVGREDDVGFASFDLPAARTRWEEIRGRVFLPADWLTGSSSGTRSSSVRVSTGSESSLVDRLRRLAETTGELINSGRDESEALADLGVEVPEGTSRADDLLADWRRWSKEWEQQVNGLTAALPPPPGRDAPEDLVSARQALARALNDLRLVPVPTADSGMPTRSERAQRFDAAESALQLVRDHLARID